jgi:hypothetical protein
MEGSQFDHFEGLHLRRLQETGLDPKQEPRLHRKDEAQPK